MSKAEDIATLAKVRTHIDRILETGQSVTADGRTLSHVNLDTLWKSVGILEKRIGNAGSAAGANSKAGRNRLIAAVPRA